MSRVHQGEVHRRIGFRQVAQRPWGPKSQHSPRTHRVVHDSNATVVVRNKEDEREAFGGGKPTVEALEETILCGEGIETGLVNCVTTPVGEDILMLRQKDTNPGSHFKS